MNNEISQNETSFVSEKLNVSATESDISSYEKNIKKSRIKILACLIFMVISALVTLYFIVEQRTTNLSQIEKVDVSAYVNLQTALAMQGNQQAMIWLAKSGNADNVIFDKLRLLIETSTNPEIIEVAISLDDQLKVKDETHKGFNEAEIVVLKQRAIEQGSSKYLLEKLMGENK